MNKNRKIFVLGLDGATWDLLNPLMDQGVMPNMKKLVEGGSSGILNSTTPPYTAPAWVSCVTGVNPGKHGVFGFTDRKKTGSGRNFVSSNSVRVPKLWNYINDIGKTAGLINIPITYPAEPIDGFVVPSFLTPLGKTDYTYPISIYKDFLKPIDYVINVRIAEFKDSSEETIVKMVDDLKDSASKRYEVLKALKKKYDPDFLMIVFTCLDKIQHKFWKYLDPQDPMYASSFAEKNRPYLLSLYTQIDEIVGKIVGDVDENTTLYIVSDHGFGSNKKTFFVNKWLAMNQFIKVNKLDLLKTHLLFKYFRKLNFSNRNIDILDHPIHKVISSNSLFIGSDPYEQGIYYLGKSHDPQYAEQIKRLREELKKTIDPDTGEHLFDEVFARDELYTGDFISNAPDIIFKMKDYGYSLGQGIPFKNILLKPVLKPLGTHRPEGIFAVYGDNIAPKKIDASIMDVAPTILYNMGIAISKDIDGKVLQDIFVSEFKEQNKISYTDKVSRGKREVSRTAEYNREDKEEITNRLRDLGYMD